MTRVVFGGRLRARYGEIGESIFARVRERRFDPAGSEDAEYVAGLRAATLAGLDYVLSGIEGAPDALRRPVPAATLEQARRAARTGVGLDTVLRRYVTGYTVLEECVVREAQREQDFVRGGVLADALASASISVERLIAAVSEAYTQQAAEGRERDGQNRRAGAAGWVARPATHGEPGRSRGASPERRRERVVRAVVEEVARRGCAGASVERVLERAAVSRRTFEKQLPGGIYEGLARAMDMALVRAGALVSWRLEEADCWEDGVRHALAALLVLLDGDPALARVCFVEAICDAELSAHRRHNLRALCALILARVEHAGMPVQPAVADAVIASAVGLLNCHLQGANAGPDSDLASSRRPAPMIELLGPLMKIVARPFVDGEELALEHERRGEQLACAIRAGEERWEPPASIWLSEEDDDEPVALPPALARSNAWRARECLSYLSDHPDVSNSQIAQAIGMAHRSQISRLLSELTREGLVAKRSEGPGKRNVWRLSPLGHDAAERL